MKKPCCINHQRNSKIVSLYEYDKLPAKSIGLEFGLSARQVLRIVEKHGAIRSRSEAFRLAIAQGRMKYDHLKKNVRKKRKTVNPKLRYDILNRDCFTCQTCGDKAPNVHLQIDHKNADTQDNRPSNLWAMCMGCNYGKKERVTA